MIRVAVGLGSSLGDRRAQVERAVASLRVRAGARALRVSRWYRTPPMRGGTARGWFLNGVAVFDTPLEPLDLLEVCVQLERRSGRRRARYWGDRTLDLDLLLAEGRIVDHARLLLPHPAIQDRAFVLLPLREAWREAVDPRTGTRYADLVVPRGPTPVPIGVLAARPSLV